MSTTAILSPPAPPIPTEIPGLEVAVAHRPAGSGEEASGDFYDMFEIGPGDWTVAIGDVSDKGFDAAVLTVLIRDTIPAAALRNPQPSQVLGSLNRELLKHPAYYLSPDPSDAAVLTDEPELARSAPGPVLIGPAP